MKYSPSSFTSRCAAPRRSATAALAALLILAGAGLSPAVHAAPAATSIDVNVNVRSTQDDLWDGFKKSAPKDHGKLYLVAALKLAPSQVKLMKPVDEAALLKQIRQTLNSHGFREITSTETPDIVLTILYGRGWLRNPYLGDAAVDESGDIVVSNIGDPKQAMRQKQLGFEAKAQSAQLEKLFLVVNAWKYPTAANEKKQKLWKTTMIVDDPDRRDFNQVYESMLAAGGGYFDHLIKEEEIMIPVSVREGHVTLGPLKIIESGVPDQPERPAGKK